MSGQINGMLKNAICCKKKKFMKKKTDKVKKKKFMKKNLARRMRTNLWRKKFGWHSKKCHGERALKEREVAQKQEQFLLQHSFS